MYDHRTRNLLLAALLIASAFFGARRTSWAAEPQLTDAEIISACDMALDEGTSESPAGQKLRRTGFNFDQWLGEAQNELIKHERDSAQAKAALRSEQEAKCAIGVSRAQQTSLQEATATHSDKKTVPSDAKRMPWWWFDMPTLAIFVAGAAFIFAALALVISRSATKRALRDAGLL